MFSHHEETQLKCQVSDQQNFTVSHNEGSHIAMSRERRSQRIVERAARSPHKNEFLAAFGEPAERVFDPNRHFTFQDEDDAQEAARWDREAALQDSIQHRRQAASSAALRGLYVHYSHGQLQNRMEVVSLAGRLDVQMQRELMLSLNKYNSLS